MVGMMETGRWDYSGFLKGYVELQRNQPEFLARSGSRDLDVWGHRVLALAPSVMKTWSVSPDCLVLRNSSPYTQLLKLKPGVICSSFLFFNLKPYYLASCGCPT